MIPAASPRLSLDAALRTLRVSERLEERRVAFERVFRADRQQVVERMAAVRPWQDDCDTLQQVRIHAPPEPIRCERAIVLYAAGNITDMVAAAIDTLTRFGGDHARIVVFATDDGPWQTLRWRKDCDVIRCSFLPGARPGPWAGKSVLFAAPRYVEARTFLALEADVICLGDMGLLWQMVEAGDPHAIWGAEQQFMPPVRLDTEMRRMGNDAAVLDWVTGGRDFGHPERRFRFNGGVLAGSAAAFRSMDRAFSDCWPFSLLSCEGSGTYWMDEVLTNLFIKHPATLAPCWNQQVFQAQYPCVVEDEPWWRVPESGKPWIIGGEPTRLMHFIGGAPAHAAEKRRLFWETYRRLGQG